jgi:hypothetical protein
MMYYYTLAHLLTRTLFVSCNEVHYALIYSEFIHCSGWKSAQEWQRCNQIRHLWTMDYNNLSITECSAHWTPTNK